MKKVIAVVLCVALLFTLSVTAFAKEVSPEPEKNITIILRKGVGVEGITSADKPFSFKIDEATVTVKVDPNEGKFDGWNIYVDEGNGKFSPAKQGEDYLIVKGDLNAQELTVEALTNIVICANYNGVKTDPAVSGTSDSPKTADMSVAVMFVAMVAAAGFVFTSKKVFSK